MLPCGATYGEAAIEAQKRNLTEAHLFRQTSVTHNTNGEQNRKKRRWYGLPLSSTFANFGSPRTNLIRTGAAKLRPSLISSSRVATALPSIQQRYESNVPAQQDPKKTAQTIIDALPGNNLASKTAILSAGTGVSVWAISNELYVLNEESVVAFCLLTVFYGIFKYGGPMYKDWSDATIGRFKEILNTARKGHAEAVKTRIEDVKPLSNVVEITKGLFEVSKVRFQIHI